MAKGKNKSMEKKNKKKIGNEFGIAGFVLVLAGLFYDCAMLYMMCTPPLILLFFGLTMGILGIIFCSIQISRKSSKLWTILSILSIILAILGVSINIILAGTGSCF